MQVNTFAGMRTSPPCGALSGPVSVTPRKVGARLIRPDTWPTPLEGPSGARISSASEIAVATKVTAMVRGPAVNLMAMFWKRAWIFFAAGEPPWSTLFRSASPPTVPSKIFTPSTSTTTVPG
jgi:hypothetical protein